MVSARTLFCVFAATLVLAAHTAQAASVFGPARILAAEMEEDQPHPFRFAAAEMTAEPTQFQVSSEPRDRPEVTYGACGQPLCPPATVYGPPPAAYECDCTEVIPHPDCVPICKAKAPAPNPLMPYTTCKCPYGVALSQCPCGGPRPLVGEGFPITQAVDLSVPQKADERGFAPSVEPSNPLPAPQDNECRPNIARHGPGNCRTTPKSASACSSAGSNCAPSSAPSSGAPAREVQCACKYAPPAPCRCVNVTGSKALVDDAEGFKGPFGKPGSLVDAFAKQIADKVLQAIAPQISGSVAAAAASASLSASPPGLSSTVSGSSSGSLSGSLSSAEVQCSSKEDCNKKFDKLMANGDPEAEKQLLVNESKRLNDLAKEYKRMEKELQKKIDGQVKKHGKANPALQKALARIKKQSARLTDAVSQARKETMKLVQ